MGTRSLTFTYINSEKIICLYRQYDGYPEGHGAELAEILTTTESNGIECLSATIVAKLKTEWGNIYLYPSTTKDAWQEYEYHIYDDGRVQVIKTYPERRSIFEGTHQEFKGFCKSKQKAEAV
jgi:hypothetical protein